MSDWLIDVFANGAVKLGSEVICDGFIFDFKIRVQTHIHDDHMTDFNRSKGLQDIYLSQETHELLIDEYNADLNIRSNLHPLQRNAPSLLPNESKLTLVPSNHMLGASQVLLELPDGKRIGYSGDFGWPLEHIIQVDELVVDATYGRPTSVRRFTQAEAETCLCELVVQKLRHGSVHIHAHRGTIERVVNLLSGKIQVPIVASHASSERARVYQKNGFAMGNILALDSVGGNEVIKTRSYVRLYSKGDRFPNERVEGTAITVSAYLSKPDDPLTVHTDRNYTVAMSNHADFNETLQYIHESGAKRVITDCTRAEGFVLAEEITKRLGIEARPSSNREGFRWR